MNRKEKGKNLITHIDGEPHSVTHTKIPTRHKTGNHHIWENNDLVLFVSLYKCSSTVHTMTIDAVVVI